VRAALLGAVLLVACGGSGPDCPNDLPPSCPSPMPSYKNDVAPIITNHCLKCHSPGGEEAQIDLTNYPNVFFQRQAVLTQSYSCNMPPDPEPRLDSQERALLLGWLVCHAPNN